MSLQPDSREGTPQYDIRAEYTPIIQNIVSALGGLEQVSPTESQYILGDSCLGCLKDLKRLWRKDDTDDERTVARILYETRVFQRDLVPILLATAGVGKVEDKCALACADLITAMTWPIDVAEELKELDDELDGKTDYTTLIEAQRSYKAAMLRPGAIAALFSIMVPPLAKSKKERNERDNQIINLILHCFRNLAFIKDPPPNIYASGEQAEFASLQSKLIVTLHESNVLLTFLTFASNADQPMFNPWNNLLLEIFYLFFRGVNPQTLPADQAEQSKQELKSLLEKENASKKERHKYAGTRHSRFGTTITIQRGDEKVVMHRQAAIQADTTDIMDMKKKKKSKGIKKQDELAGVSWLSQTALTVLQTTVHQFIQTGFNRFVISLLKDIRMERAKITEKDNVRLLFLTAWCLEFFLAARLKNGANNNVTGYAMVKEVVEEEWVKWVLKRMREAADDKPKQWVELQAGINCLTQLLLLIESMANSDTAYAETASVLQQKLYYNAEILDFAFENLRSYREQNALKSIAYLEASVHFSHVLMRMLQKWAKSKGDTLVVRKKKKVKKKKAKGVTEEDSIVDVPTEDEMEEAEEEEYGDAAITFDAYEHRFANPDVNATLLQYLKRYEEFDSSEKMDWVVRLLFRQAVNAKAERLFFKVSTLDLFHRILKAEKTLPKDTPYLDLCKLMRYVVKKFFKAVQEDSFLMVEAFFPIRASRKGLGGKSLARGEASSDEDVVVHKPGDRHGPQLYIKGKRSWSEQLGVAIACLIDAGQMDLIDWTKETLIGVIGQRQRIISDTDDFLATDIPDENDPDAALKEKLRKLKGPSAAAVSKFEDYIILYVNQDKADAATKNQHLKLMWKLLKFFVTDEDADELEWYVPAAILPDDLQRSLDVIDQYVKEPLQLDGKKASELIAKRRKAKTNRRTRRRRGDGDEGSDVNVAMGSLPTDDDGTESDEPRARAKRKKKEKERLLYKSAELIVDSDAEIAQEDDDAFFARERELRRKTEAAAAAGETAPSNMAATGTKKRKKREKEGPAKKFKTFIEPDQGGEEAEAAPRVESVPSDSDADGDQPPAKPIPRPRPRPKARRSAATDGSSDASMSPSASMLDNDDDDGDGDAESPPERPVKRPRPRARRRFGGGASADDSALAASASSPGRTSSPAPSDGTPSDRHDFGDDDDEIVSVPSRAMRKRLVLAESDDE
ncbi:Topoisomerase 1-associated factor 1 [Tulasnella sp. 424]|nr:Topoisomerase 1-associated factor 1 [Tulasnella sp. 424]KAG8966329.1 Topoisomerase 1-associated factor 1 [Tulasnella sp. 425]